MSVAGFLLSRARVSQAAPVPSPQSAPASNADEFDDPKLAREGVVPVARVAPSGAAPTPPPVAATPRAPAPVAAPVPVPPPPAKAPTEAQPTEPQPAAPPPPAAKPPQPAAAPALETPSPPDAPPSTSSEGKAATGASVDLKATARSEAPTPVVQSHGPWPYAPRLKLAYRRFPFSRIAAVSAAGVTTSAVPESFESISLDAYPMSWYLRVGLSTQFGWESGQFQRTGDYFFAESASVGFQLPGRFTPFVEALAGAGYMRRRQPDSVLPTAYWQLGVDAGVEIYFANRAYGSLAIGYLHPANLFFAERNLQSVNLDTWSLKIGIGI